MTCRSFKPRSIPVLFFFFCSGLLPDTPGGLQAATEPGGLLSPPAALVRFADEPVQAQAGERNVPAWFNEGFAALFEQSRVVEGKLAYGNPNPWREKLFRPEFEAGRVPSLSQYLCLSNRQFYEGKPSNTYYNTGRSLFLFLLTRLGEPTLQKFVKRVLAGLGGIKALEHATGKPIGEIEALWRENIRSQNFGGDYLARAGEPGILEDGVSRYPDFGMLRLKLARACLDDGKPGLALYHAETALKDPRLPYPQEACRVIAQACLITNPRKALASLKRVIELQPWTEEIDIDSFTKLAGMLEAKKDKKGAELIRRQLSEMLKEDGR
jgi:hypothetical protein